MTRTIPPLIPMSPKALSVIGNWLVGDDTGVSSSTMVSICLGAKPSKVGAEGVSDYDAPHDSGDFGRCLRLVRAAPEIRANFNRISRLVPSFKGILENWSELETMYADRTKLDLDDSLYVRLTELRRGAEDNLRARRMLQSMTTPVAKRSRSKALSTLNELGSQ